MHDMQMKQPSAKMPISASFFVHANRKSHSQGIGNTSMIIFVASSDPVTPQESVCSFTHRPTIVLFQKLAMG